MKITFNDAVDGDFTTKLIYFTALKQHALAQAQTALREVYGDDLSLSLFDQRVKGEIESVWASILPDKRSDRGAEQYKKFHMEDRYLSSRLDEKWLFPENYERETLERIWSHPYNYKPEGFEVAIWMGNELCGVANGGHEKEYEHDFISVFVVEGSPYENHRLKGEIKKIVDVAASYYAQTLGVGRVAYFGPYSKGAEKKSKEMKLDFENIEINRIHARCYTRHILESANDIKGTSDFTIEIES